MLSIHSRTPFNIKHLPNAKSQASVFNGFPPARGHKAICPGCKIGSLICLTTALDTNVDSITIHCSNPFNFPVSTGFVQHGRLLRFWSISSAGVSRPLKNSWIEGQQLYESTAAMQKETSGQPCHLKVALEKKINFGKWNGSGSSCDMCKACAAICLCHLFHTFRQLQGDKSRLGIQPPSECLEGLQWTEGSSCRPRCWPSCAPRSNKSSALPLIFRLIFIVFQWFSVFKEAKTARIRRSDCLTVTFLEVLMTFWMVWFVGCLEPWLVGHGPTL